MMKALDKLFARGQLAFALTWIAAYVVVGSLTGASSEDVGPHNVVTVISLGVLLAILLGWVRHHGQEGSMRLVAPHASAGHLWYAVPLVVILASKLAYGLGARYDALGCVLWVAWMVEAGALEELIFRGLLFNALDEMSRIRAVVVSSVTFGIGHIVNAVNGSGQSLFETLVQVAYAVAIGFLLVEVMLKSGSMVPVLVFHAVHNALSAFLASDLVLGSQTASLVLIALLTVWSLACAALMAWRLPDA